MFFFLKGLYPFTIIFTYFQAPNTSQRFLPKRVHSAPPKFPTLHPKIDDFQVRFISFIFGGLDFSGEPTIKLQRCTYWPLQPTQVPSFIDNLTSLEGCIPWVVPSPRWWSTFMLATCFFVLFFLVWNFSKGPKGYEFESNRYSRPWGVWCCMLLFKTEKLPGANRSKHIWYLNHQYIQVEE